MTSPGRADTLIITGKGGVGKTTCAAATAIHLAGSGVPVLVVSTDPAHSLGSCLQRSLGPTPVSLLPNLWGMELDALAEMRTRFDGIRRVLIKQMQRQGLDETLAEEMSAFPGAEELFSLIKLAELKRSGRFEAIVMDTAPTGNTLRFLHFPEFLSPVRRALGLERAFNRAVRPLAALLGQSTVDDEFYVAVSSLFDQIEGARKDLLASGRTYFRLVLNPEKLAVVETQRAVSFLNISGFIVDALFVNKILPDSITDPFFTAWKQTQKQYLREARQGFHPLTILEVPLYEREVLGVDMLRVLGHRLYGDRDPLQRMTVEDLFTIRRSGQELVLSVQVPSQEPGEFRLYKEGPELIMSLGTYERKLQLPAIVSTLDVRRARRVDNVLSITFG
jgi:arsenite-transporting ATPase